MKRFLLILLFTSFFINAQDSLFVKLSPNNGYNRLMLYKIKGVQQEYISNAQIENNAFKFEFPLNSEPGMYRLFFDIQNSGFFEVIYNNENISVELNTKNPTETTKFFSSKENQVYQNYIEVISKKQSKLDSLQLAYLNTMVENTEYDSIAIVIEVDPEKKRLIEKVYSNSVIELNELQQSSEKMSEGLLAHHFIRSNRNYNSESIIETLDEYYNSVNTHFFDAVDFSDIALRNSSFFIDKVVEYVFYLNHSEDQETYIVIKQKAINEVILKIGENYKVKSEILSSLMFAMAGQQEIALVDFIKKEHYEKLPFENQNIQFILQIDEMLRMAIGSSAPEITWEDNDVTLKLSELEGSDYYIITFWSTSCSHCIKEIPELYVFTDEFEGLKVIAVALEETREEFDNMIQTMPNWIHVLGLNKWENKLARSYDINSTPTYFVLDKNKKIIAKPDGLEDLKLIFGEN